MRVGVRPVPRFNELLGEQPWHMSPDRLDRAVQCFRQFRNGAVAERERAAHVSVKLGGEDPIQLRAESLAATSRAFARR